MASVGNVSIGKEVVQVEVENFHIVKKFSKEINWTLGQSTLQELRNNDFVSSVQINPFSNLEWTDLHGSPTLEFSIDNRHRFNGKRRFDINLLQNNHANIELQTISLKGQNLGTITLEDPDEILAKSIFCGVSEFERALLCGEVVMTVNLDLNIRHKLERNNDASVKTLQDICSEFVVANLATENALELYDMFSRRGLNFYKRQVCKYILLDMKNVIQEYGVQTILENLELTADCLLLL